MKAFQRQLYGLSIFHAVNDGSLAVFLAVLPVMRVALGLSFVEIGTILSAGILATVVMQLVFGHIADMGQSRHVLTGGFISVALVDLMFVKGGSYAQVLLLYVLFRAAAGVYHPVSFATIFRTASNRSTALGFQSAFGDGSIAFGMLSMGFVAESFGWQTPFLIWGIVALVGFAAFVLLMRTRKSESERRAPEVEPDRSDYSDHESGITRGMIILQLSTALVTCLFTIFSSYIPLFLNVNLQLSPGVSSLVVALWLGVGVVSSFNAGGWVSAFGTERKTARACFGLTTILLAAGTVVAFGEGLWTVALAFLVMSGVTFFPVFPVMYGVVGGAAPKNRLGLAYATNLSLSLIAGSVASYGIGYLASIYTLTIVLPILLILSVVASLVAFLL